MKKILAIIISVLLLTFSFTACVSKNTITDKKGKSESVSPKEEGKTENKNAEKQEPDTEYQQPVESAQDLESLIDTFTNSEDEAEKEAARIQLEAILEQAEQKAQ
ncbi:MAG: hypothetical protein PHE51_08230 [Eubacteriales bacterium]|nr:hypothetical protein [Eubacteriales bacterium]